MTFKNSEKSFFLGLLNGKIFKVSNFFLHHTRMLSLIELLLRGGKVSFKSKGKNVALTFESPKE